MDNFLKTDKGFETTLKLVETINRSTDDYLFVWDIPADKRWFYGNVGEEYALCEDGRRPIRTEEMLSVVYPPDVEGVAESLRDIVMGRSDDHNRDYRWVNRQGERVWVNCHGTVIRDEKGNPYLMLGRVSEENLRHLYNPITSLWNKVKLQQDLKNVLAQSNGYLVYMDVDNLAAINLAHGRAYGDGLLRDVAEFLERELGTKNAYHVDHNYFGAVMHVNCEQEVLDFYRRLSSDMQGKCTLTAGVVPISNQLFLDEMQILDAANMTLKKAKQISDNRMEFFSAEDLAQRVTHLALLEDMKQSIENGYEGFEVYYQPQVRAGSYEIYGVEALLRYTSKERGMVFPNEFIPVLEQSRLIHQVGIWVLDQALKQCREWRTVVPDLRISVNFSPLQFEDPDLAEKIIGALRTADLEGEALTVEFTESMEVQHSEQLHLTIEALKNYNISFAIDDFGTGYSNLGYLKQLNIDEIKIDRVFVKGIEKDTYNHKLVSNVLEFARVNSIRTCCEGVENMEELVTLEVLFPDVIQGYLFDKPNCAEVIERTYICSHTAEYVARQQFIEKIREYKLNYTGVN